MSVAVLQLKEGQKALIARMIHRLETGGFSEFISPWKTGGYGHAPRNGITGRRYGGYNRLATTFMAYERQYLTPFWLTRRQIEERGGKIKEGESPTSIVFSGRYLKKKSVTTPTPEGASAAATPPQLPDKTAPLPFAGESLPAPETTKVATGEIGRFVREYAVWNLDQTVDVKLPKKIEEMMGKREEELLRWTPSDALLQLRQTLESANVAPIFFDRIGDCYYDPGRDEIHAPEQKHFNSELDMWLTIAHEVVHATGAKHRLNRPVFSSLKGEGSLDYALEEVTAVMGSLIICQETGVQVTEEREKSWGGYLANSYIADRILKQRPELFIAAVVAAEYASNYVLHPELRPDFVTKRKAPNQYEMSFEEYSPKHEQIVPPIDGDAIEKTMDQVAAAADELERAATVDVQAPEAVR